MKRYLAAAVVSLALTAGVVSPSAAQSTDDAVPCDVTLAMPEDTELLEDMAIAMSRLSQICLDGLESACGSLRKQYFDMQESGLLTCLRRFASSEPQNSSQARSVNAVTQ